jgi:tRNA pseudouridine(55) synthase
MNVPKYVVLNKKRGITPLEAISAWKVERPEFAEVSASYAGRLDPMAEGKLLVLLGDECKKQDAYIKLDKEYEVELVFDLSTDTGDVLGLATYATDNAKGNVRIISSVLEIIRTLPLALSREQGSHSRQYPVFSSKTVNGKPLFLYALENKLDDITIPEHIETIYKIKLLESREVLKAELQTIIQESLAVVPRSDEPSKELGADFRQDAVRARWDELFKTIPDRKFTIVTLRVTCASGAYMRTLAERIGHSLDATALALSINRTKIGEVLAVGPVIFWKKLYL